MSLLNNPLTMKPSPLVKFSYGLEHPLRSAKIIGKPILDKEPPKYNFLFFYAISMVFTLVLLSIL